MPILIVTYRYRQTGAGAPASTPPRALGGAVLQNERVTVLNHPRVLVRLLKYGSQNMGLLGSSRVTIQCSALRWCSSSRVRTCASRRETHGDR